MNWYLKVLKQYLDFKGRARRKEFWMFMLINTIISFVIGVIAGLIKLPIIGSIYSLLVFIPSIAVGIRRMHDIGRSGWFILIPIYNIILWCEDSFKGLNEYGPNPKSEEGMIE
ncbi:DUF805 domain-containing protein [Flavobacterium sp. '19STA2R22 D10 B1']|uniref:DUF805 domain-containing protein n=1 Tax=Flavobacterium aerium TaxID=3037261 RepID=UPI00278BC821|nr:DUF805 domain-containing protein [Flavobacterium sp. '19STA2R22 D10 B1']